jgi:hypothetical protein
MEMPEVKSRIRILKIESGKVLIQATGVSPDQWLEVGDTLTICTPVFLTSIESFPQRAEKGK